MFCHFDSTKALSESQKNKRHLLPEYVIALRNIAAHRRQEWTAVGKTR